MMRRRRRRPQLNFEATFGLKKEEYGGGLLAHAHMLGISYNAIYHKYLLQNFQKFLPLSLSLSLSRQTFFSIFLKAFR